MATTDLGFPYPENADPVDVAGDIQALADQVDAVPGVGSFTAVEVAAFTVAEKRAGRVIWNETTGTLQRSSGSAWVDIVLDDDSRLDDTRDPKAHAASHAAAGTDPVTVTQAQVTGLVDALAAKGDLSVTINPQTDSYTLVLTDAGKQVDMNKPSAVHVTVPPNSSVAFPVGTEILIVQVGTGAVDLVAGSGVTINTQYGLKLTGRWAAALLVKRATDTWLAVGALTA